MASSSRWVDALVYVVPVAVYVVAVFVMGSLGPESVRNMGPDKLLHGAVFGVMVPLLGRAIRYFAPHLSAAVVLASSALLALALGGLLEVHQLLFTRRSAEVADFVADALGILLAGTILWLIVRAAGDAAPASPSDTPP